MGLFVETHSLLLQNNIHDISHLGAVFFVMYLYQQIHTMNPEKLTKLQNQVRIGGKVKQST